MCQFAGCTRITNKMKWHAYKHLPDCFGFPPSVQYLRQQFLPKREASLRYLAQEVVGEGRSLEDLTQYINANWAKGEFSIAPEVEREMQAFAQYLQVPVPVTFSISPLNSPAALLHWRPLMFVLGLLTSEQQRELMDMGRQSTEVPDLVNTEVDAEAGAGVAQAEDDPSKAMEETPMEVQKVESPPILDLGPLPDVATEVVDSHLHLDRLENKLREAGLGGSGMQCIRLTPGRKAHITVRVVGGVLNYCDPECYARIEFPEDPAWRVAVGIHPKKAHKTSEDQWHDFMKLVQDPRVVGVSEVGLDHSVSASLWKDQDALLTRIVGIGHADRVLILHLRGSSNDLLGTKVHVRCRQVLQATCDADQRIHLHCCSTSIEQIAAWRQAFPNAYFGFTGMVARFGSRQKAALCSVPLGRLLLESDAPHLPIDRWVQINTPAFLGDVGARVASFREELTSELLKMATANARRLYRL